MEQIREWLRGKRTDLEIHKTAKAMRPLALTSQRVDYTIEVTNHGPAEATNIVVEDTLEVEAGLLVQVIEPAFSASHNGEWTLGAVTGTSAEMKATIPSLPATETATLEFAVVVQVDPPLIEIQLVDTAEVSSDLEDSKPQNDSVTLSTTLP